MDRGIVQKTRPKRGRNVTWVTRPSARMPLRSSSPITRRIRLSVTYCLMRPISRSWWIRSKNVSFHSHLHGSFNGPRASDLPRMYTSPVLGRSASADLRPIVSNKSHRPLTCSALHLRLPAADPAFSPPLCHHSFFGARFYGYYGFICRPSPHHIQRYRVA